MQPIIVNLNDNRQHEFSKTLAHTEDKVRAVTSSPMKKCVLDMDVISEGAFNRKNVEHFIHHGFAKTYNADVSITMPWLLTIRDSKYKAALGIRSATSPLFIEQYISEPIEQAIAKNFAQPSNKKLSESCFECNETVAISRSKIAEIGHLYSNGKRFTLPLLLVTAVSLFCNDYRFMVFSGTEHVLKLIAKTGVKCSFIADAKQENLNDSQDNWGTYYETNPKVVSISLIEVMTLINDHPLYASLFENLNKKIAKTTSSLRVSH
jgi:Thermostable hemolysin